jgi:polar amino acid transport system substrate-binding protein
MRGHRIKQLGAGGVTLMVVWLGIVVGLRPGTAQTAPTSPSTTSPITIAPASGRMLRVATKKIEPFVFLEPDGSLRGYSIDLWTEVARRLGATTTWVTTKSIDELLATVTSNNADVAIAGISMTPKREEVLDFSHPYFDSGLQVMVRNKGNRGALGVVWETVKSPAIWQPFLVLLIASVVIAHVMWLAERRHNPDFPRTYGKGMWESFWWSIVNVTTGGDAEKKVRRPLGRITAMLWMATGVFLVAYLTGSVTSAITVKELRSDITGISDLDGRRTVTVKGSTSAALLDQLGYGHDDVLLLDRPVYDRLRKGEIDAIVFDSPVLRYAERTIGRGQLRVVGPIAEADKYGIALPAGSVLREPIDRILLEMAKDGTNTRLMSKWFGA